MKDKSQLRPLRVGMISLGCAKNLVDSEIMLGTLLKDGVEITNEAAEADVVIVNTCSFIDSAQQESVDTILESDEVRQANNRGQALVVSGCLPQRFREELPKLLPEVDAFMGIDQVNQVTQIAQAALSARAKKLETAKGKLPARERTPKRRNEVHFARAKAPAASPFSAGPTANDAQNLVTVTSRPNYIPDYGTPRFRLTPRHFAYVKIAEGCNHPCSFCIIPRMRGVHRSRSQADVVAEVKALVAEGVKEIHLISQDSTYYGLDLRRNHTPAIAAPGRFAAALQGLPSGASTICTLLRELNSIPGNFWIRLLYTHPAHWTDELIRTMRECRKIARYVDIPLQHIHGNMLERMRRETSQEYIVELLKRIRSGVPGIALRTTFIVGFPGETEEYFETLLQFIRETKFERLGVFAYSQEQGTRAGSMAGQVPDKIKQQRREKAMATQHEVAVAVAESFVLRTIPVLIEREASTKELQAARVHSWEHGLMRAGGEELVPMKGRFLVARGEADAPDIDGRVYIRGKLPVGEFATVRIVAHTDYDLIAEPAS